MRVFSFSETYGPFSCENGECSREAWDVFLTDCENEGLPEKTGPTAAKHILLNGIGRMLCESCLEERIKNELQQNKASR